MASLEEEGPETYDLKPPISKTDPTPLLELNVGGFEPLPSFATLD